MVDMRGGFGGETDEIGRLTFPGWAPRGLPTRESAPDDRYESLAQKCRLGGDYEPGVLPASFAKRPPRIGYVLTCNSETIHMTRYSYKFCRPCGISLHGPVVDNSPR